MLSSLPIRKWTTKQGDSLPARSASKHHLNILNSISNKQETWFNHDKHARDVYSLPFICLLWSIFKLNLPEKPPVILRATSPVQIPTPLEHSFGNYALETRESLFRLAAVFPSLNEGNQSPKHSKHNKSTENPNRAKTEFSCRLSSASMPHCGNVAKPMAND